MKKKLALILASCLTVAALLVGCGSSGGSTEGGEESSGLSGTFALTGLIDAEGNEMTLAEYAEANGVDESSLESSYTFNGDGTGTISTLGTETEITYAEDGSSVTVTINGIDFACEYDEDAGTLSMSDDSTGNTSIMTKQ